MTLPTPSVTNTPQNFEKAALRGEPSFVWRFGQNRRLDMIVSMLPIDTRRILVDGCGVCQYVQHLAGLGYNTIGLDIDFEWVRERIPLSPPIRRSYD